MSRQALSPRRRALRRLGVPIGRDGRLYAAFSNAPAGTRFSAADEKRLLVNLEAIARAKAEQARRAAV